MLKFMKHQQHKLTPERIQKQRELFDFRRCCHHGFPSKPSALAWEPNLRLLAIGTKSCTIRLYGKPGVEIYGQSEKCESPISQLVFISGQCRLVSLCEDNSLHLWEITEEDSQLKLKHVKTTSLEGKLKRVSVIVPASDERLMVGTEGGNIYLLDLENFTMLENIIYQDVVMQNVPEDYKLNPGPVEAIAVHPREPSRILIGYQRGLIVLWDTKNLCADQTYVSTQQLESVCWQADATHFTTSHNDGSYMEWSSEEGGGSSSSGTSSDGPHTVYGPFPCKPINKIMRPSSKDGTAFIIFSGGMPRASYGDRNTVTVIEGENHVTFSLSSKVIDFEVIRQEETDVCCCLVILAEEEIVFIDLQTEDWPAFHTPYLASLHSSAVTCSYLASGVTAEVMNKIKEAGKKQNAKLSPSPWPVDGGKIKEEGDRKREEDILLTGHEDGTVQFWHATTSSLHLLYKLSTASLFVSEDLGGEGPGAEDDDWPPFRKAGLFDPYSDDPRLGVKKLQMCPYTGSLVIAGTAGQVILMGLSNEGKEITPQVTEVNLVADNDGFVWKSHGKLDAITGTINFELGMQPTGIIQFYPPASCTSLALHSEWGLVACGTAHGFALFDTIENKNLLTKSTLSPLDLANTSDEGPMSRRKSLKKSLRESFRRLRRGRSQKKGGGGGGGGGRQATTTPNTTPANRPACDDDAMRPVERAVEARSSTPDYVGSMVRCLHLTKCFIANNQAMSATLWAGTNSGAIYVFTIAIPPSEKRREVPLTVQLGKEIHLKHGAPVLAVWILDGGGCPFPPPMSVKKDVHPAPNATLPHRVLICSEEQFKVFTLPQLKPFCKFKLTAHEGTRARKLNVAEFVSSLDEKYSEKCLVVGTNHGDLSVYSLPDCRRQAMTPCIKREDISGINSLVFTQHGEALYQVSASEMERVSLSAAHCTTATGTLPALLSLPKQTPKKPQDPPKPEEPAEKKQSETTTTTASTTAATAETTTLQIKGTTEEANGEAEATTEVKIEGATGGCVRKAEDVRENGDNSVLSGDITIDSIRDHIVSLGPSS